MSLPLEGKSLTPREIQVLALVARGLPNRQIAQDLGVSETTVKTHVRHIIMKLQANDRTQAAVWAVQRGLI
jgi:two-component system, NarL family, response regulator LiaR